MCEILNPQRFFVYARTFGAMKSHRWISFSLHQYSWISCYCLIDPAELFFPSKPSFVLAQPCHWALGAKLRPPAETSRLSVTGLNPHWSWAPLCLPQMKSTVCHNWNVHLGLVLLSTHGVGESQRWITSVEMFDCVTFFIVSPIAKWISRYTRPQKLKLNTLKRTYFDMLTTKWEVQAANWKKKKQFDWIKCARDLLSMIRRGFTEFQHIVKKYPNVQLN